MPLRISTLTLNAFRAFPHEVTINFNNKNLLVYGENGAGKSSIYHALKNFFSLDGPDFRDFKNVFNGNADADFCTQVQFNDGQPPISWTSTQHLGSARIGSDPRIAKAALRKAALDYRALLDTNYVHGNERPNLFEIVTGLVLADYPVTVEGGTVKTIGQLWREAQSKKPLKFSNSLDPVNEACVALNQGLRGALDALQPHLDTLLTSLLGAAVSIPSFSFSGVTYSHSWWLRDRVFKDTALYPDVSFAGHAVIIPQAFLNEARLSALALSMYLAGRLASVPQGGNDLKLLVLDDVLIGLDHENRMPVLRVINDHFSDWQVVILTHDKVWFDMARKYFEAGQNWEWLEVKADGQDGRATPTLKAHQGDVIAEALDDSRRHIGNDVPAAANSARRAFEATLRRFAEKRRLKITFKLNPKDCKTDVFLSAIDTWVDEKPSRADIKNIVADLRAMQNGVLNPQSHADAPNPSTAEVNAAIQCVENLKQAISDRQYN